MADILKRTNVENKDFDFTADDVNELIDAINLSYNNGGTIIKTNGDGTKILADDGEYKSFEDFISNSQEFKNLLNKVNNHINNTNIHLTNRQRLLLNKIIDNGNGTKFLSDDGTYKTISSSGGYNYDSYYDDYAYDLEFVRDKSLSKGGDITGGFMTSYEKYSYAQICLGQWLSCGAMYAQQSPYIDELGDRIGYYAIKQIQKKYDKNKMLQIDKGQEITIFLEENDSFVHDDYENFITVGLKGLNCYELDENTNKITISDKYTSFDIVNTQPFTQQYKPTKIIISMDIKNMTYSSLGEVYNYDYFHNGVLNNKPVLAVGQRGSVQEGLLKYDFFVLPESNNLTRVKYEIEVDERVCQFDIDIVLPLAKADSKYWGSDNYTKALITFYDFWLDNISLIAQRRVNTTSSKLLQTVDDLIIDKITNEGLSTEVELSDYYTKSETDNLLSEKSKVQSSDKNGYIKIDDNDVVVYQNNGVINTLKEAITYDNYEFYYIFNEKNKNDIMVIDTYYHNYNTYQVKILFDPKEENHFYRIQTTNLDYACFTNLYYKDNNNNIYSSATVKLDPNSIYYVYFINTKTYYQKISDGNINKNFNSHTLGYYINSSNSNDVINFKFYKDGILYGDNSINKTTALSNQNVYLYYDYNSSMNEYTIDYFLKHVTTKYGIYCYIVFGNNSSIDNYVETLKKTNSNIQSNNFYIHFLFVVNGKCLKEKIFYSSNEITAGLDYVLGNNVFLENDNIKDGGIENIYTKGSIKSNKFSSTNIKLYDSDTLDESKQMFEIGKTTFNNTTTDIATMLHHKKDYASVIGYQQPEDSSYAYGSYIVFDKYNKLKRTYGDTYSIEFRQPAIFNEDVKFLGTVEGTINSVPTGCYSKTEVDNKFLALSGNTKGTAMSGEIYLGNSKGLYGVDTNGNPIRLTVHSNGTNYFGVKDCPSMIRSSNNPQVMVGDKTYTMYHTGNKPKVIENCCWTMGTSSDKINMYYKLASFEITNNYGSYSGEFNIGFSQHGNATSPHYKLGVWVKRQDSVFSMDLKLWGYNSGNFAKFILVKTGTYQATLYAYITNQYTSLYMTQLGRVLSSASETFYSNQTPISTIGTTQVVAKDMDKISVSGGLYSLFSGVINATGIATTLRNVNNCVNTSGQFVVPATGKYRISGLVHNKNHLYFTNINTTTDKWTLMYADSLTVSTSSYLPFTRDCELKYGKTFVLSDKDNSRSDWTSVSIDLLP